MGECRHSFFIPSFANIIFACYLRICCCRHRRRRCCSSSVIQTFFVNAKSHIVRWSLLRFCSSALIRHFIRSFVRRNYFSVWLAVIILVPKQSGEHCLWIIVSLINFFIEFPSLRVQERAHMIQLELLMKPLYHGKAREKLKEKARVRKIKPSTN